MTEHDKQVEPPPVQTLPGQLSQEYKTHTVESGDTLGAIAEKNGVELQQLLAWNSFDNPDAIQVGDVVNLFDPKQDVEYTVVAGDTVSELAEKFGKRWVDIAAANKLEDVNHIEVGQKLLIIAQGVARGR